VDLHLPKLKNSRKNNIFVIIVNYPIAVDLARIRNSGAYLQHDPVLPLGNQSTGRRCDLRVAAFAAPHELTSLLTGFKGVLQSDAYGAYPSYERKHDGIVRVGCWAHARVYFVEALDDHPRPAQLVLRLIRTLYQLEAKWDEDKVGDQRAALRHEHFAQPLRWLRRIVTGLGK